jgi:hypothetical protein
MNISEEYCVISWERKWKTENYLLTWTYWVKWYRISVIRTMSTILAGNWRDKIRIFFDVD